MQRSFNDLHKQAVDLGLVSEGSSVVGKAQLVSLLREHFQKSGDLPYLGKMSLFDGNELTTLQMRGILNSPDWIAEEKFNGVRCRLYGRDGVLRFSSVVVSVKNFNYGEIFCLPHVKLDHTGDVILEGELTSSVPRLDTGNTITESPLQVVTSLLAMEPEQAKRMQREQGAYLIFKAFDSLVSAGQDLTALPWSERRKQLDLLCANDYFQITQYLTKNKEQLFEAVTSRNGEGVVLKNIHSPYLMDGRPRDGWIKIKTQLSVDAWVSGVFSSRKQKVAGLEFSAFVDHEARVVAMVPSIPDQMRADIECSTLNPIGRVAELIGQGWSGKARRLVHARIGRFRTGADAKDVSACTVSFASMESNHE